jgi:hypothetical protein
MHEMIYRFSILALFHIKVSFIPLSIIGMMKKKNLGENFVMRDVKEFSLLNHSKLNVLKTKRKLQNALNY